MILVTFIGHVLACFAKLFILPHLSRTLRVKTVHYGQIVQPPIFHSSSAFLPSVVQWVEILSDFFFYLRFQFSPDFSLNFSEEKCVEKNTPLVRISTHCGQHKTKISGNLVPTAQIIHLKITLGHSEWHFDI